MSDWKIPTPYDDHGTGGLGFWDWVGVIAMSLGIVGLCVVVAYLCATQ